MTNKEGFPTGAIFGFIRILEKFFSEFSPEHLCVVFDGPNNKAKRLEIYADYKKNRSAMPEDLYLQLIRVLDYCNFSGLPLLQEPDVEADDVIGSITKWMEAEGWEVVVISADKDLCQLVSDKTKMLHIHKENKIIDREEVKNMFGVNPEQIVDYLAIAGDSSDNIPGIPGFGPKTSVALLQEWGSVNNLLDSLDSVKNPRWREKIEENRDKLLLSQKLASLHLDVSFPKNIDFFKRSAPDNEKLASLFKDMNFSSLLKKLGENSTLPAKVEENLDYNTVETEQDLQELIALLNSSTEIAFDTETTGLDRLSCQIVGISFSTVEQQAFYIPFNGALNSDHIIKNLKPIFANKDKTFIAHNLKFDMHVLATSGIALHGNLFDTLIAAHLVEGTTTGLSLDTLTLNYYSILKKPITELIGSGKKQISMMDAPIKEVSTYSCADVDFTLRLKNKFLPMLEQQSLSSTFYTLEMPLIPVLFDMERAGVLINTPHLSSMSVVFAGSLSKLEKAIFTSTNSEFNIKSPKQLAEVLFDTMQIKPPGGKKTTKADVLEKLKARHPFIKDILEYRTLEKLRSTYVDALPTQVNKNTGRIHCNFSQVSTATGRLACQNPNLQNIPIRSKEGKKIREAFTAQKGSLLLSADYSQIELRLLAHFSNDTTLTTSFIQGEDIHIVTAAKVFHVSQEEVTSQMRSSAKAVNFGILYGQSAFGLASSLDISPKEAQEFIRNYFTTYPQIKTYLQECKDIAKQTGVATTLFGRKRPLKDINASNGMVRSAAERLAVNTPIQGSQADIIKIAMIQIQNELKKSFNSFMTLQIHDELLFEVHESEIETLTAMVKEKMEGVVQLKVPLPVNILVGKNWAQC